MQQKSKIIVFVGQALHTGIYRHLAFLGAELYKACPNDYDFVFASIEREANQGAWRIVRASVKESNIICCETFEDLANRCVQLATKYEKAVIHTGGGWGQTKYFVRARKRFGTKAANKIMLVGTTHSYRHDSWMRVPMSMFQYVLYRMYYRMIVFQCQYAADHFVGGNDLIKRGRGVVVPLGCEPFSVLSETVPAGIASRHELCAVLTDPSLFKFVYLAAFRPGKMHSWLVAALAPVLRRNPSARILLCGMGSDEIRSSVISLIHKEGVSEQILVPGLIARDEVPWLLGHSNCAIVPSRSETFGHNFLEPMFAGLPVLGTRVGIGRDIIRDGKTGFFFDLTRTESVQHAVETMLSDPIFARTMGECAKKSVEACFTHAAVARQLMTVYSRLLD